jgi:hypothetical protein
MLIISNKNVHKFKVAQVRIFWIIIWNNRTGLSKENYRYG